MDNVVAYAEEFCNRLMAIFEKFHEIKCHFASPEEIVKFGYVVLV